MSATFAEAARTYAGQVRQIRADQWDGPGLGEWDLRSLVGHASRSLVTVETYLGQPAAAEDLTSPAAYYVAIHGITNGADPASIVERGRQAGLMMGDDPAAYVDALVGRVLPMVERDDDPLLSTIAGGMRLGTYLPTRTFELVVHGFDIAGAAGVVDPDYSVAVLDEVAVVAATAAVRAGRGRDLILALTGRVPLPAGFSVV